MLSEPGNSRRRIRPVALWTFSSTEITDAWPLEFFWTSHWLTSGSNQSKARKNEAGMELKVNFWNIRISVIFCLCTVTWQSDLICFEMFSQGARGGDHRIGPGFGQGLRKEALAGRSPGDDHQPHHHHDYHLHFDHPTRHHDRHINHQISSHQEKSLKLVSTCFSGVSLWYTRASRTCYKGRVSGLIAIAINTTIVNLWFLVKTFSTLFKAVI